MSLNHLEAVPVDTHVYQIASKHYMKHLKAKTITDKIYNEIGDYFRDLYGPHAGWGQTVAIFLVLVGYNDGIFHALRDKYVSWSLDK